MVESKIFGTWHWNDTDVMWATFIIAACMLVTGIGCMLRARGSTNTFSLGASLVSGAFVTVAIFGLQLASNLTAEEESFQLGIAMQSDLSGFDPQGRSLEKAHFNSKTLDGAKLRNADLRQASLRNASLRDAQLHGATSKAPTCWPPTCSSPSCQEPTCATPTCDPPSWRTPTSGPPTSGAPRSTTRPVGRGPSGSRRCSRRAWCQGSPIRPRRW